MEIAVLDTGVMGQGIAQASASAGHVVRIYGPTEDDPDEAVAAVEHGLERAAERSDGDGEALAAAGERVSATTSLDEAVAGVSLVVEAGPEDLGEKQRLLAAAEEASENAVLATHTSALSIADAMGDLTVPERSIGLHFFNPVPVIDFVEVVKTNRTDDETLTAATDFVESLGKETAVVDDVPGFVSTRIGTMLCLEGLRLVESGVATPAEVDAIMRSGYRYPMGPIELSDHLGLDVQLDVLEYLREELGERFRPPQVLKNKVRAGNLGKKTGEGFYVWEDGQRAGMSDEY